MCSKPKACCMRDYFEPTIKRYLRRWRPTQRPATIHSKSGILHRFVAYLRKHYPAVRRFSQLQREPHIEGWLESLLHLKPVTRNTAIRTLRLFCEDLNAWQWPNPPPLRLLSDEDLAPEPAALPRPLSPELDQAAQKAFCEAGSFPAMAFLLLRYTGMRLGEMRELPLKAVEPSGPGNFSLRIPVGKTYSERLIPLDDRTVDLVRRIIAQRGCRRKKGVPAHYKRYLMISPFGKHMPPQNYQAHIKDLTAHLDPTVPITCHRLRHTYATEMARAGMPVPALMKLLGHKTPKMTMRYVEVAQNDVRQAYNQAMTQLSVIRSVQSRTLPALPVLAAALPQQTGSDQLLTLMAAMITCLESHRRDELDASRSNHFRSARVCTGA